MRIQVEVEVEVEVEGRRGLRQGDLDKNTIDY